MNIASADFLKNHPEKQLNADGQISQKYVQKTEIATIIGKEYNFGFSTVTKYDVYARALDELRTKGPEITMKILNGSLRVSHENVIELSRLPIEDINGLKRLLDSGSIDRIGYSQLRHELRWQRLPTGNRIPEDADGKEKVPRLASNRCLSLTRMQNWQALNLPFLHGPRLYQGQWNLQIFLLHPLLLGRKLEHRS